MHLFYLSIVYLVVVAPLQLVLRERDLESSSFDLAVVKGDECLGCVLNGVELHERLFEV